MNKQQVEKFCRGIGIKPVLRATNKYGEVLIADGEINAAAKASLVQKGELTIEESADAKYATWFFVLNRENNVLAGKQSLFSKNHEPLLDEKTKGMARVNTVRPEAESFLQNLRNVQRA